MVVRRRRACPSCQLTTPRNLGVMNICFNVLEDAVIPTIAEEINALDNILLEGHLGPVGHGLRSDTLDEKKGPVATALSETWGAGCIYWLRRDGGELRFLDPAPDGT